MNDQTMIKAGKTYKLSGIVNTKDGLKPVTVFRKVLVVDGDKIVFDKDGVPTETDRETFERLAAVEVPDESTAFGIDCRSGRCEF